MDAFGGANREAFDRAKLQWSDQGGRYVVNVVRDQFLSGQSLGRRTGTLVRSINYKVLDSGDGFTYGTNVVYGVAWELGFERKAFSVSAINAKALRIPLPGGEVIFRKSAFIPAQSFAARPFLAPAGDASIPYLTDLAEKLITTAIGESIPDSIEISILKA